MSVEETKSLFFTDGYATINEVFPIPVIDAAYLQAMRNFDEVNQVIDSKNLHFGIGIKNGFTEIVQRHSHRFEMSYHMDGSEFDFVLQNRSIRDAVSNILECENFIIANRSLVVSRPGCTDQAWHSDGPHVSATQYLPCHVLNVFIPLVDVNIDNGPTEFRPGSQFYTRNLAKSMLIAKLKKQLRPVDAPCIKKGSILLVRQLYTHMFRWRKFC